MPLGELWQPGPSWSLSSGPLTFFLTYSHKDPGLLAGLPLAAEIPPGEAIRFGPLGLQPAGPGARVGHLVRGQRSAICGLCSHLHPVLVAGNAGTEEGGQEEVGSTDYPAVSTGAPRGGADPDVCRGPLQTSHPHPCWVPHPQAHSRFHPAPCTPLPRERLLPGPRAHLIFAQPAAAAAPECPGHFLAHTTPCPA